MLVIKGPGHYLRYKPHTGPALLQFTDMTAKTWVGAWVGELHSLNLLLLSCSYDANELERTQLREQVLKHKAEMEALATEHMEELSAIVTAHETELMLTKRHNAELERQLEAASSQLAQAQVWSSSKLSK